MTVLLNFLGGPSSGKTSLSASVFAYLKAREINAEYSSEFVKTWAWEGRIISPFSQYYIFGKECQNQSRLFNKVDVLISDSPVMLAAFYQYYYNKKNTLSIPCHDFYNTAENNFDIRVMNFFLPRMKGYDTRGRYQTEEQSDEVARLLKGWLLKEEFNYTELCCPDEDRLSEVIKSLELATNVFNKDTKAGKQ